MNISVPADLKRQMGLVREPVNWSQVAAEAFSAKLLDLRSRTKGEAMDEVIARMKAAAELEANEGYQEGRRAGERWAKQAARPKELKRLEKELEEYPSAGAASDYVEVLNNGHNMGTHRALAQVIAGE